jgi:ribosomal protein L7/L12
MTRTELTGWREGLNKIKLNQLLRQYGGLGLADAKEAVDRLLAGERVAVPCADEDKARSFCEQAIAAGADCAGPVRARPDRGVAAPVEGSLS